MEMVPNNPDMKSILKGQDKEDVRDQSDVRQNKFIEDMRKRDDDMDRLMWEQNKIPNLMSVAGGIAAVAGFATGNPALVFGGGTLLKEGKGRLNAWLEQYQAGTQGLIDKYTKEDPAEFMKMVTGMIQSGMNPTPESVSLLGDLMNESPETSKEAADFVRGIGKTPAQTAAEAGAKSATAKARQDTAVTDAMLGEMETKYGDSLNRATSEMARIRESMLWKKALDSMSPDERAETLADLAMDSTKVAEYGEAGPQLKREDLIAQAKKLEPDPSDSTPIEDLRRLEEASPSLAKKHFTPFSRQAMVMMNIRDAKNASTEVFIDSKIAKKHPWLGDDVSGTMTLYELGKKFQERLSKKMVTKDVDGKKVASIQREGPTGEDDAYLGPLGFVSRPRYDTVQLLSKTWSDTPSQEEMATELVRAFRELEKGDASYFAGAGLSYMRKVFAELGSSHDNLGTK